MRAYSSAASRLLPADFLTAHCAIFQALRAGFESAVKLTGDCLQAPGTARGTHVDARDGNVRQEANMFRHLALVGVVLLLAVAARPASGDARMQAIMRTKLSNTQALLKAIVTTDFKEIDRAAGALSRISEMEIVSWQNPPKREYTEQAMLFMSSVDDLREAAQRRDIEAVGAAYSALITTCVHCHTYVRDARIASLMALQPFQ
jgi:hypothetical protein